MDQNELFREATLRICSNLEIEEALKELLQFLKDIMPVLRISMQYYDNDFQAMRTIAFAGESGHGKLDVLTSMPEEARKKIANAPDHLEAFLVTDPMSAPISKEMLKMHNLRSPSLIVMPLRVGKEKNILGMVVFISEENKPLDESHLSQLILLKEPLTISLSNALIHREVVKLNDLLADDNRYLHGELRRTSGEEIIGADFGLRDITRMVQQVASLDSPVLLLGETGTGKDLLASSIHYASSRSEGAFISINCGAIPDTLIDSELFGHEKGAFTGALSQKRGRFERANKGTIFLDEIGELPPQAQVRLLRVLQNKEIERVGGVKTIPIDTRIIAATNRNLEEMVKKQEFREDLWFRLNVFPIWIPPLRDRQMDIPDLIQHFINLKTKELKLATIPTLHPGAIDSLMAYPWPGNVRELENVIEREMILNPTGPLTFENLNYGRRKTRVQSHPGSKKTRKLDDVISHHIRGVLSETNGRVNGPDGAAAILGVNPNTLRNRMKKLGIEYGRKSKL